MQVWTAHVHTKRLLFGALAQQRNGEVQLADDECGKALACLQVGCCALLRNDNILPCMWHAEANSAPKANKHTTDVLLSFGTKDYRSTHWTCGIAEST